ncbi:MAG: 23S rRNA (adenine(1618)-N(6))-methyltransferase RlmF [Prolixibacteraceae bacterium]|jgi:23S rRNA (adenine1618-N6)-methyltransferase|nr:23S rRNA (adenine(1618)-N(6))-methyltransferase RlmF [Prolixibacteraceae bacterium]
MLKKKEFPTEKQMLHPRNLHRERYDFGALVQSCPELAAFVIQNPYQDTSIDFFNQDAVKMLNRALLKHFYNIEVWNIPPGYLCPPVPGRADYIHHAADLLAIGNNRTIPLGKQIRCLDIGVGANCIYPIIGNKTYGWSFVGSDIDPIAIKNAKMIIRLNPSLIGAIEVRLQKYNPSILKGVLQVGENFDLLICNPPFHTSAEEARSGSQRKLSNLKGNKIKSPTLNFGGQNNELWCPGGEVQFARQMIAESSEFAGSITMFTILIAKSEHLPMVYHALKLVKATEIRTIPMAQGNKISRIVAWSFHRFGADSKVK